MRPFRSRLIGPDETPVSAEGAFTPPSLAAATAIVAAGFLASRLLGLVRTIVFAHRFGTSPELDAFFVAFRLPDLVFQLLAGATLGSAFIPAFARIVANKGEHEAWRLASSVLNLVLIATIVMATVGLLLAEWLVPLLAPGLDDGAGGAATTELAVDLTRIMMLSPVLFAVSGMFMGILNARHNFFYPAVAPVFYNLAIIVAALVSDNVRVLALAVVFGALLHMVVQLPGLRLVGMRWSFVSEWRDAAVREVARLMGPRMLGLAAYHLNFIIATFFASTLRHGAISAMNYAWLIVMTPLGLFGMAISTAVFPRLADQAARQDEELRATIGRSLRLILFLTLPAAVGLMLLARPLTALLLRGGAFDAASADLVVPALVFYAAGLPAHSGIEILSRGFYALSDTKTPVAFAVLSMLINLVLALALVWPFELAGLAVALSLAAFAEFLLLAFVLNHRLSGFEGVSVIRSLAGSAIATLLMAELVALWLAALELLGLLDLESRLGAGIAAAGGAAIGVLGYAIASRLLHSEEARLLTERLPVPSRVRRAFGM